MDFFTNFEHKPLVRVATAGSVDDGKSTLIGRLLVDSHALMTDQLVNINRSSVRHGHGGLNFAYITDGLRAEREQAITIDVAYRYFSTANTKFILADTPGHFEFTRNMVTGASLADILLLVLDVKVGITSQTIRHLKLANLLRISKVIVCVNKMDLVDYSQHTFNSISAELINIAANFGQTAIVIIPISALHGENVASPSKKMNWYDQGYILDILESFEYPKVKTSDDVRLSVQSISEVNQKIYYHGYLFGGTLYKEHSLVALPINKPCIIENIYNLQQESIAKSMANTSITFTLKDHHYQINRGHLLISDSTQIEISNEIKFLICWFDQKNQIEKGKKYVAVHLSDMIRCQVNKIEYVLDLYTNEETQKEFISVNEIGMVILQFEKMMFIDHFGINKSTGTIILIDETTNDTVAIGWRS